MNFVVSDQGPGIDSTMINTIFEKFSRQEAKSTGGEPSSGLGLAISKTLVELHGGKISAKSEGKGQGASFVISIPLVNEGELQDYESGRAAHSPRSMAKTN